MAERQLDLYQIDAFAERCFSGNPAAVVPLEHWLSDEQMLAIAAENNLSETAYFVRQEPGRYALRWFTPAHEVDLCGHATLASAYVIGRFLDRDAKRIAFDTLAGELLVTLEGDNLTLDFPSRPPLPASAERRQQVEQALGSAPLAVLQALNGTGKLMAVLADPAAVAAVAPDFRQVAGFASDGLIVTASGVDPASAVHCDFVSRYFAPHAGIDEDPVTGSAHCVLVPYWAQELGKSRLVARQISKRGGTLACVLSGDRVLLTGKAALYMTGKIHLSD